MAKAFFSALHIQLQMQIQKTLVLAFLQWCQKAYKEASLFQHQFECGLPDHIDRMDFQNKILELSLDFNLDFEIPPYAGRRDFFDCMAQKQEEFLEKNIRILLPGDPDYPDLRQTESAPIFCVQGAMPAKKYFLTVVGSRTPSVESLRWMNLELPMVMKNKNMVVISGAARGVDQEAHQLALANKIQTLAFLPCGIDHVYPDSFLYMKDQILKSGGAVISGFAPWQKMHKSFFYKRNEWMVTMSDLVLVVEANRGGGSLMTGKYAADHSKLASVPVHPMSSWGLGNNDLLVLPEVHVARDAGDVAGLLFPIAQ